MPVGFVEDVDVTSVTFEGWLDKRRKHKTWMWKTYWFCLEGDQLAYYKDKQVGFRLIVLLSLRIYLL